MFYFLLSKKKRDYIESKVKQLETSPDDVVGFPGSTLNEVRIDLNGFSLREIDSVKKKLGNSYFFNDSYNILCVEVCP